MYYVSLILAAIVPMAIGFAWYHPKLFGNAWMKGLGYTEEDMKSGNMGLIFGLSFLVAIVIAYALSLGATHHPAEDQNFMHGAYHAARNCLFYAIPVLVSNSLFQRNSLAVIGINALYWVATFAVMGGLLYAMV